MNKGLKNEYNYYETISFGNVDKNADTDGDGLLDNAARYIGNKKIMPQDPQPFIKNAPIGLIDKHIYQLEFGKNATRLMYKTMDNISASINDFVLSYDSNYDVAEYIVMSALELRKNLYNSDIYHNKIGDIRAFLLNIKNKVRGDAWAAIGAFVLDFAKDNYGIAYHSRPNTWQKMYGYNKFYDEMFELGSPMKKASISFSKGEDKYVLWLWKGDYWNLGSGAEIGLYTDKVVYSGTDHYHAVDFNLPMTLSLYNYKSSSDIQNVFCWIPNEKQWWITGFRYEDNVYPNSDIMRSIGTVDFYNNSDLFDELCASIKDSAMNDCIIYDKYDTHDKTIWVIW